MHEFSDNDLKTMIYNCMDAGELAMALKHLNTYMKVNPNDPSISVILDVIKNKQEETTSTDDPNWIDDGFDVLIDKLSGKSEDEIYNMILENFINLKPSSYISQQYIEAYRSLLHHISTLGFYKHGIRKLRNFSQFSKNVT